MRAPRLQDSYLVVELTNRCVAACRHCIQRTWEHHAHFSEHRHFDADALRALAADCTSAGLFFDTLILFWLGEPLMHPEFAELYVELLDGNANRPWFGKAEVHTNAILLTPELREAALARPDAPARWHFSLDASTPETHQWVKGVDRFAEADGNAQAMLEERGVASNPRLVFQFVVQPANAAEAPDFVARWVSRAEACGRSCRPVAYGVPGDGADHVFLRQLDALDPTEQPSADRLYAETCNGMGLPAPERMRPPRGRVICSGPWKSPTIGADGRVTVCTRDSGFLLQIGEMADASFPELWWEGEAIARLREAHRRGGEALPMLCQDCPIPRSSNYTTIRGAELAAYEAWRRGRGG